MKLQNYFMLTFFLLIIAFNFYCFYAIKHDEVKDNKTLKTLSPIIFIGLLVLNYFMYKNLGNYYSLPNYRYLVSILITAILPLLQIGIIESIYNDKVQNLQVFNSMLFCFVFISLSIYLIHIKSNDENTDDFYDNKYDILFQEDLNDYNIIQ